MIRLRDQGMAYIRFALAHQEQHRLATAPTSRGGRSGAHQRRVPTLPVTVRECMDEGTVVVGDPLRVVLRMWALARGIASLVIAAFRSWGEVERTLTG